MSGQNFHHYFNAAQLGYTDLMRLLLKYGADVNLAMKGNGWTPMHVAAWRGHDDAVTILLEDSRVHQSALTKGDVIGISMRPTALFMA